MSKESIIYYYSINFYLFTFLYKENPVSYQNSQLTILNLLL